MKNPFTKLTALVIVFCLALSCFNSNVPEKSNFTDDYRIDLKPDHALIKTEKGTFKVRLDSIEEYIINDNL